MTTTHVPIVIVGAGFGGVGLGVELSRAGIDDYQILERVDDIGGTWTRNNYPGSACDVPSVLYCYSYAPNPNWSRKYASAREIVEYIRDTADCFGVSEHIRYGVTVTGAVFDEDTRRWQISTDRGDLTADVFVSAVGAFAEAKYPDIEGLADFAGETMHSLHWDHSLPLEGKRVAVIGTGASAIQIVPQMQRVASQVTVFQRTPSWVVPRLDHPVSPLAKAMYRRLPVTQRLMRGLWYAGIESIGFPAFVNRRFRVPFEAYGRYQLRRQVADPALREKLTPRYMLGCKRAIFADEYYPALCADNVTLVTEGIDRATATSLVDATGTEHEVDVIIFATGFTPMPALADLVKGTDGRTIDDLYREKPQSYLGVANAGFPNMFTLLGPFGAAGNQSAVVLIEAQARYITDAICRLRARGLRRFELKRRAQDAFVEEMHGRARRGTWLMGGCQSYYTNGKGLNAGLYPGWSFEYRRRTRRWDDENYELAK